MFLTIDIQISFFSGVSIHGLVMGHIGHLFNLKFGVEVEMRFRHIFLDLPDRNVYVHPHLCEVVLDIFLEMDYFVIVLLHNLFELVKRKILNDLFVVVLDVFEVPGDCASHIFHSSPSVVHILFDFVVALDEETQKLGFLFLEIVL